MRVFTVVALAILLLEAVLVLAFLAGFYWIGGWMAGVLLSAGVLLILCLLCVGELVVRYDSSASTITVRLSWWGSITRRLKPEPELCIRILGIPWRKRIAKREPRKPTAEREPRTRGRRARGMIRLGRGNAGQLVQALLAGLQGAQELLAESRELSVRVTGPTQIGYADQAIAGVIGSRRLGPLALSCTASGERRVAVQYRIGLLRAALTGLVVAAQARPWRLARSMRSTEPTEPKEGD